MKITRPTARQVYSNAFEKAYDGKAKGVREQAKVFRDGFESLAEHDQIDAKMAQAVRNLAADSPSDKADLDIWHTALNTAAHMVGGPTGTTLLGCTNATVLSSLLQVANTHGQKAKPFLDSVVPPQWTDSSADFEGQSGAKQWGLGVAHNLLQEDRADALGSMWLVADRVGERIGSSEIDNAVKSEAMRLGRKLSNSQENWVRPDDPTVNSLHGHQVSLGVIDGNGKRVVQEGVLEAVEPDRFKPAQYRIKNSDGVSEVFNINQTDSIVARDYYGPSKFSVEPSPSVLSPLTIKSRRN